MCNNEHLTTRTIQHLSVWVNSKYQILPPSKFILRNSLHLPELMPPLNFIFRNLALLHNFHRKDQMILCNKIYSRLSDSWKYFNPLVSLCKFNLVSCPWYLHTMCCKSGGMVKQCDSMSNGDDSLKVPQTDST